jgi:hypothetical protein
MTVRRRLAALFVAAVVAVPATASAETWSLAYPPLTTGTTTPNLKAPLPEWTLWFVFQAESACQEQRALWQMVVKAEDEQSIRDAGRRAVFARGIPPPSANMDALEEGARQWVRETGTKLRKDKGALNQILVAECIAASDPRLAR